jgi:hypothetical protein
MTHITKGDEEYAKYFKINKTKDEDTKRKVSMKITKNK